MKPLQKRYGFRKYRGIGLASVAIASVWLANPSQEVAASSLEQGSEVSSISVHTTAVPSIEDQVGSQKTVSEGEKILRSQEDLQPSLIAQTASNDKLSVDLPKEEAPLSPVNSEDLSRNEIVEGSPAEGLATASETSLLPDQETTASFRASRAAIEFDLPALDPAPEVMYSSVSTERLTDVFNALKMKYSAGVSYDDLSEEDRVRYEEAVYNEYANHLVENAMGKIESAKTYTEVPSADRMTLFTKFVLEERRLRGNPTGSDPKVLEAVRAAEQRVLDYYNQNLYVEPTLTSYAQQNPEAVKSLIKTVLAGQALTTLETQGKAIFRGLYLLHSQYNFESGLPEKLVSQDPTVTTNVTNYSTPMQNLIRFGSYANTAVVRNKSDLANILRHNKTIYTNHIQPVIGTTSQLALVEKLAAAKQETSTDYFLKQTEATVQISDQVNQDQLVNWLYAETNLLIPLLAQGQGTLVGLTRDSVVIGLNDIYKTSEEVPALEDSHQRGIAQTSYEKLVTRLNDLENFNTFLREASRYGSNTSAAAARPLVVRDSLVRGSFTNGLDSRVWQTKENNATIRHLFAPLGDHMSSPTYNPRSNIEGEKQSETHFVAYNTKVLGQDKKGLTLYSHEMTHANDERVLFDGTYGGTARNTTAAGNRRQGQGAEVYARSLFEALNNTQTTAAGNIRPVFNLNTSVPVTDGSNNDQVHQIQPSEPLNTPEKLANYQNKLIKLLMWMEAKEAKFALDLSEDDRRLYFNKVEQKDRTTGNSTNDNFVVTATVPTTLEDLVTGSYVTAGFTINGTSRLGEVKTDGYHFVPLLDSFYGANYAPEGKNTVGDISFKRNAHEILGWYGFDAMLDYLSGRYDSDQAFLTALQNRQTGKADIISGKVEATPQATKLAQYQALLDMELTNVPEEIKAIYTPEALKKAIDADVAVLRAARDNNQAIYYNMTNVRNLKQKLLSELIETTDMMTSDPSRQILDVKGYDVIYVANGATGNGETATTPMSNLKEAIAKVREGGRIVLVGNVTERTPVTIDKNLTIEGETADRALLLNQDLTTTKPVTLKGLTLQLNKESQATGLIKAQADLTLDGVSTKISDRQESQRPAIVLEGDQPVNLQILNNRDTKLASITATTEGSVLLDKGVTVVGPVQAQTTEPVTVTSRTNFATEFLGDTLSLTLSENSPAEMTLDGIQSLTLRAGARASLSEDTNSSITDQLTIAAGSTLDATINNLSVRTLDGTGTLRFDESAFFKAEHSRAATTIEVTNDTLAYEDEKPYVIIPRRDVEPSVSLTLLDTQLTPDENGHYIYKAPYQLFHEFEALDATLTLPASVNELLKAFEDNEELTAAPQKPANPAQTSVDVTDGRWEFRGWVLELDDQAPKIHVYKGQWTYTPKPSTVLLTYAFAFEGKVRDQFPENQVTLPAQVTVDKGYAFVQPAAYTQVFESRDGQGEWQFKNWSLPTGSIVQANQTITGTWTYHAYRTIPITTSYQANDQAEVGTANTIVTAGREGLQSALTNRVVREMQARVEQVGTKPKVVGTTETLPIIYKSDDTLAVGQPNRIETVGQPTVITTTTTYRIENGQAVANPSTTDRKLGIARVEVVGTKPTVERVETASQVLYEADERLEVGVANVLKQSGQPTVTTTTTTYSLVDGRAVANEPQTVTQAGHPTIYQVGTKPKVVEATETLPIIYKSDDTLEVGQPNRIETVGQPTVIMTTTTYRIENGQAVANPSTTDRKLGIARVEVVGTKPTVTIDTIHLPIVYEEDSSLDIGSVNIVKQVGKPTVRTTTITYRIENGQAVANNPQVTMVLGQSEIQLVGTKQEQNGGSDTTDPLPIFDPTADSDGDGYSNGDELTAGSDPYSASSVPASQNGGSDTTDPLPIFDPKQEGVISLTVPRENDSFSPYWDKREESASALVEHSSTPQNRASLPKTGDSGHHAGLGILGLIAGLAGFLGRRKS